MNKMGRKMRKMKFLILLGSVVFLFSCKPALEEHEQKQIYDKEIIRLLTNFEKTIDLLETLLEKMNKEIEENRTEIDELQARIDQLEKDMKDMEMARER